MRLLRISRRLVLRTAARFALVGLFASLVGCEGTGKVSAQKAAAHMEYIAKAVRGDVKEIQSGMPAGAKALEEIFQEAAPEVPGPVDAREALLRVRAKNNDLDSAKSTFFLIATADGTILRNNLEEDEMAGKNLFEVYPAAEKNRKDSYYEFNGTWDVARGVNNKDDAQHCAVAPIRLEGKTVGYFVSGFSWSSYAYRLETSLRSEILQNTKEGEKVPLLYVYVLAGGKAYGAPVSPEVNGQAILKLNPLEKTKGGDVVGISLEITRREFGVALRHFPELGDDVVLAVLRSET